MGKGAAREGRAGIWAETVWPRVACPYTWHHPTFLTPLGGAAGSQPCTGMGKPLCQGTLHKTTWRAPGNTTWVSHFPQRLGDRHGSPHLPHLENRKLEVDKPHGTAFCFSFVYTPRLSIHWETYKELTIPSADEVMRKKVLWWDCKCFGGDNWIKSIPFRKGRTLRTSHSTFRKVSYRNIEQVCWLQHSHKL